MRRILPFLAAGLALFGLMRLFQTVRRYDPALAEAPNYRDAGLGDISVQLGETEIISRSEGTRQWSLEAARVDIRSLMGGDLDQFRAAVFSGVRNGVLYRTGRPETLFSAKTAAFDQTVQRFTISGAIRVHSVTGDSLKSEELVWSQREDFVRFPRGASGIFEGNRISAPTLMYAPRKRLVQCAQGADIDLKDGAFSGHVAALFWDVPKKRVDLPGPITGRRGSMQLTAERAVLDLNAHTIKANKATVLLRIEGEGTNLEKL